MRWPRPGPVSLPRAGADLSPLNPPRPGPPMTVRAAAFLAALLSLAPAAARGAPQASSGAAAPLSSLAAGLQERVGRPLPGGASLAGVQVRGRPPSDHLLLRLRAGGGETARVIVSRLPSAGLPPGATATPSLLLLVDPRRPPASLRPALAEVISLVARQDHGQFARARGAGDGEARGGRRDPGGPATPGLLPITWALLALSLLFVPLALRDSMGRIAAGSRRGMAAMGGLVLLALTLRLGAGHRLVMVYFGYLHVDQARELADLPRYGAATAALYHALFRFLPAHHHTVQGLHVLLGSLTILPLSALAAAPAPPGVERLRVALLAGLLLALSPLSVLDHGSESILVPAFLWWACGAVLLRLWVTGGGPWRLVGAGALLTLSGLSRPDCLAVALPGALLVAGGAGGWGALWARRRPLGLLLVAVALLSLPGVRFLQQRAQEDAAMGNLPHLRPAFLLALPRMLARSWVVLHPRYHPLALTLLAGVGLVLGARGGGGRRGGPWVPGRGQVGLLVAASLLWAIPMMLDFNETSMLRLHAPSASLLTLAGASGVVALWVRVRGRLGRGGLGRGGLILAIGAPLVASYLHTVPAVFAPQNSDQDEALLELVAAHSHDGVPAVYVTRSYDDPPDRGIHLFHPRYALEPGDRWQGVAHFERGEGRRPGERVYFVADLRCYAHRRGAMDPGPGWRHPACVGLCRRHACREVFSLRLPNLGERAFDWYPTPAELPEMRVGLWEVRPSSGAASSTATHPPPAAPPPRPATPTEGGGVRHRDDPSPGA